MKVAVSASGRDLDSQIDPRFGRCAYFLIVETEGMTFEAFDNESIAMGGGAGISAAQFVASKGARTVITGNCGPNAVQALTAAGIDLFVGQSGSVRTCVERFKRDEMKATSEPNVAEYLGMGGSQGQTPGGASGTRRGMGTGRGKGMGCGMGKRCGTGMGSSASPVQTGGGTGSKAEAIDTLKEQASGLTKQMEEIQARIRKLEEN